MIHHHNTTGETGQLLIDFEYKAKSQEELVYLLFKNYYGYQHVSASGVRAALVDFKAISPETPITSIRRALSNLTREGKLARTNFKTDGPMGRPECCWKLS